MATRLDLITNIEFSTRVLRKTQPKSIIRQPKLEGQGEKEKEAGEKKNQPRDGPENTRPSQSAPCLLHRDPLPDRRATHILLPRPPDLFPTFSAAVGSGGFMQCVPRDVVATVSRTWGVLFWLLFLLPLAPAADHGDGVLRALCVQHDPTHDKGEENFSPHLPMPAAPFLPLTLFIIREYPHLSFLFLC